MEDIKRKGVMSEIFELTDDIHPLAGLSSITLPPPISGIEEDIKRKGIMSEIIKRLTKLEEDVRKLQTRG